MTTTTSSATAVVATIASAVTGASSAGPRILVTGATGNTGFCTLSCISSSPEFAKIGASVRAACYRQSKKIDQVRQKCPQVEIVTVDAEIADDLDNAFQDIDYAYIIPSSSSNRVQHVKNYVDAAKRNNVKFLLFLSWIRDESTRSRFGLEFETMERYIENSSIAYAFIRTGLLLQTLFLFAPDLRKGILPLPIGPGRVAPINALDVCKLALTILREPARHDHKAYHLVGTELVNGLELARIASDALGRPVRFIDIHPVGCKNLLIDSGVEEPIADGLVEVFLEISRNRYAFSDDLLTKVTGLPSSTIYAFFLQNKERFTVPSGAARVVEEGAELMPPAPSVVPSTQAVGARPVVATGGYYGPTSAITSGYGRYRARGLDPRTMVMELERTKDILQRWIYQQEALLNYMHEIAQRQEDRMRDFLQFRAELVDALADLGSY